jgi:hypothetical protein
VSHVDDRGCTGRQRAALDAAPHNGQAPQVRVKRNRLYASTSDHARERVVGLRGCSCGLNYTARYTPGLTSSRLATG